jgi:phosphatidylglycerol:prolipoprotein diacylglycerol transferase
MIDWTPSAVALQLGPLSLYWYGICYAIGLAGAYYVMTHMARRFRQNPNILGNGLIIVAIAALAGGRLYHVIDQWQNLYAADPIKVFLPPYAGLGIFGGLITGGIAVILLTRYYKVSFWRWADIIAPGIFVMQAAGRVGNFFNQELYGPPTTLPWGIRIDCEHRVVDFPCSTFPLETTHFHPLFLYESLSGLIAAGVLIWLASRPRPRLHVGDLGAIMFIWLGTVRFLIEFLRIENWRIGNIPTAQYFAAASVVLGIGILIYRRRVHAPALVPVEGEARPDDYVAPAGPVGAEARPDVDDGDDFDDFDEFDAAHRSPDADAGAAATPPVLDAVDREPFEPAPRDS